MRYLDWIRAQGLTFARAAKRIDVATPKTVWRYAHGLQIPAPPIMTRIFVDTDGVVAPNDFYDLPTLPVREAAQ